MGVIKRIVNVHSNPADTLLDPFAGSGTLGEAAALLERNSILIDNNIDAINIINRRLKPHNMILKVKTLSDYSDEDLLAELARRLNPEP